MASCRSMQIRLAVAVLLALLVVAVAMKSDEGSESGHHGGQYESAGRRMRDERQNAGGVRQARSESKAVNGDAVGIATLLVHS